MSVTGLGANNFNVGNNATTAAAAGIAAGAAARAVGAGASAAAKVGTDATTGGVKQASDTLNIKTPSAISNKPVNVVSFGLDSATKEVSKSQAASTIESVAGNSDIKFGMEAVACKILEMCTK